MSTTPFPSAIGRYAVLGRVSRGGMGVVYRATDPHIGRTVAIKLLHVADDALRARFLKEVQFLGTLNHPNIVTIYDCGEHGDQPFIVMEYVDGVTLDDYVRGQITPDVSTKLRLVRELCSALEYAHQRAIIHRDVKPANLMVNHDGVLKVLDFGVARIGEAQATQAGTVVGTVNYMSPEQIEGRTVDKRSDIFSVGLVIYEVFALRQAFPNEGKTMWQMMQAVLREQPAGLSDLCPGLDPEVELIVNRAIDKNPSDRYQTLALLSRDLARVESRLSTVSFTQDATVAMPIVSLPSVPRAMEPPVPLSAPNPPPSTSNLPPGVKREEEVPSDKVVSVAPEPPPRVVAPADSSSVEPAAPPKAKPAAAGRLDSTRHLLPLAGLLALAAVLILVVMRGRLWSFLVSGRPDPSSPAPVAQKVETVSSVPGQPKPSQESKAVPDGAARGDAQTTVNQAVTKAPVAEGTGSPQVRRSLYDQAVGYLPTPSNPNNPARAADLFQQACDARDFRGCSDLAQMLEAARSMTKDEPRAAALYQRACDGGLGSACNSLGKMYREGRGVTPDTARSTTLFDRACSNSAPEGCYNLAVEYARGVAVPKDEAKAATLYQFACDAGIPGACANLGRAYREGQGVNQDLFRARSLLQKACDGGSAPACSDLGVLYLRGDGGDKDAARAVLFFQRACDDGGQDGCYALGVAYSNGRGVGRDAKLAQTAYQRACELGLAAGCDTLARQFPRGRGGRRDAADAETGGRAGQRAFRTDERPIRVGGSTAPVKIKDVPAEYPPAARVARIQGVVIIEATINSSGKVVATKILRSVRSLDEAAEQAVRQWEFAPTVINGVARAVVTTVTVNFSLQ